MRNRHRDAVFKRISVCGDMDIEVSRLTMAAIIDSLPGVRNGSSVREHGFDVYEVPAPLLEAVLHLCAVDA